MDCTYCGGTGRIARSTSEATYPCDDCHGTGEAEPVGECAGCGVALYGDEELTDAGGHRLCPATDLTVGHSTQDKIDSRY